MSDSTCQSLTRHVSRCWESSHVHDLWLRDLFRSRQLSAYKWHVFFTTLVRLLVGFSTLWVFPLVGLMTAGMVGFSTTGFSTLSVWWQLEWFSSTPVDVSLQSLVWVVLVQVVSFCLLYCIILSNRRLMMTEHVDESALFTPSVTSKKKSTLPSLIGDGDGDIIKKMVWQIVIVINLCWLSRLTRPQEVPRWGKSLWLHNQWTFPLQTEIPWMRIYLLAPLF
jgi:hypothetical protein